MQQAGGGVPAAIGVLVTPGMILAALSFILRFLDTAFPRPALNAMLGAGAVLMLAGDVARGARGQVPADAGCLLIVALIAFSDWWRGGGRKALRELGAKSRARVLALLGALRGAGLAQPEAAR
jgi:hypothetical protein